MSKEVENHDYDGEPRRTRMGTKFSRRLFGLLGIRSARDERRGKNGPLSELLTRDSDDES